MERSHPIKVAVSDDGFIPAHLVLEHALQLWTSEVVFAAIDGVYEDQLDPARDLFIRHVDRLKLMASKLKSLPLNSDQVTLRKFGTLLDNLGKPLNVLDKSYPRVESHAVRKLNEFGRMRSGLVYSVVYSGAN